MDLKEASAIWENVKENIKKLDSCSGPHDFVPIDPDIKLSRQWRCTTCGGKIDNVARIWYERGRSHERKAT